MNGLLSLDESIEWHTWMDARMVIIEYKMSSQITLDPLFPATTLAV